MKLKLLIFCLLGLATSGVSQASMAKIMIKHVAQHKKAYGLLLIGAFGLNEYRNQTCKRAFISLKKSGSGIFNKSKKDDAETQAKAHQAALAAEAKRVASARAEQITKQWQTLIDARAAFEREPSNQTSDAYEAAWNSVKNIARVPENAKDTADNAQAMFGC